MKKALALLVLAMFVTALAPAAHAQTRINMVLATGGTAGTYYPFGGAIAKIWNSKIPGMNVTAQATGASAENIRLVNKKEAELATVQSDTADFAYNGSEPFKEKLTKMNAIAVLYPEIIQIVVRAESGINSFADLKGKKVGAGAPGSGQLANFRQLLEVYGMKWEDVKGQYLSYSESAEQFKDKHIDGFVVVAGVPNAAIMDIGAMHKIKILTIPDDVAGKLTQKYPFLAQAKIPANSYKNQTEEIKSVAVNAVLIVSSEIKEDVVYNLTKALFENQAELARGHAKGKELNLQAAVKGASIPFHPGAAKYYKEKGVMK
jgi:TRAP transporter TAXI family solute receptor